MICIHSPEYPIALRKAKICTILAFLSVIGVIISNLSNGPADLSFPKRYIFSHHGSCLCLFYIYSFYRLVFFYIHFTNICSFCTHIFIFYILSHSSFLHTCSFYMHITFLCTYIHFTHTYILSTTTYILLPCSKLLFFILIS